MNDSFEPKILTFLCNWCSYAGADLAGVSRFQYPPTIRVMRTMCSGRVDPVFILEGLKSGFDAVFVFGCHIGDCHYLDGNLYTLRRVELVRELMEESGIGAERVQLRWVSAAEGQQFARYVSELSDLTRTLGTFEAEKHALALAALHGALQSPRLRWLLGMSRSLTEGKNVYGETLDADHYERVITVAAREEYRKARILECLREGPLSVREIAAKSGLGVYDVSLLLSDVERAGLAEFHRFEGATPKFIHLGP
jgi:F420-non-reducing hydrogenase iron-sulfur subunit